MAKKKKEKTHLTREEIKAGTDKGLEKYKDRTFLEEYALFMGVAQLLEFGLKKLLEDKFEYDLEKMEKWTMGKVAKELRKNKLREDFLELLTSVIDYRNYIAHELLFDASLTQSLIGNLFPTDHYPKSHRRLHKGIMELEQLAFLFDYTNRNDWWD